MRLLSRGIWTKMKWVADKPWLSGSRFWRAFFIVIGAFLTGLQQVCDQRLTTNLGYLKRCLSVVVAQKPRRTGCGQIFHHLQMAKKRGPMEGRIAVFAGLVDVGPGL